CGRGDPPLGHPGTGDQGVAGTAHQAGHPAPEEARQHPAVSGPAGPFSAPATVDTGRYDPQPATDVTAATVGRHGKSDDVFLCRVSMSSPRSWPDWRGCWNGSPRTPGSVTGTCSATPAWPAARDGSTTSAALTRASSTRPASGCSRWRKP